MLRTFQISGRLVRRVAVLLLVFISGAAISSARMLDNNGNGISDVWELLYGVYGVNPNADPDGDGFSNLQESIAGTDPLNSNSFPHIAFSAHASTNFSVTLPCVLGKQYQLQSVGNVSDTDWIIETNVVARSGTNITLTAPATATARFYRVAISDVDTDGDGLTDWEEYQLGLDPLNPYSNAQQDANGNALTDLQYATQKIAQQNTITITATDPTAMQPDPGQQATQPGQYTVTRGGFPFTALTVNLATNGVGPGMATAGVDYRGLPGAVFLAVGQSSQTVALNPLANTNLQAPALAQLRLTSGANYSIGTQNSASVVIYPSATSKGMGLQGSYYTNSSTNYASTNNFNAANLITNRVDPVIDFNWTNASMSPYLSNGAYSVRWIGQVQPQFSETFMFGVRSDDGCRLWVNDQLLIDKWVSQSVKDWTNSIPLQAGTKYDIRLEYLQVSSAAQVHMYWYSPSQPSNIISSSCLYPTNYSGATNAPSAVTSSLNAIAFLGQPFSFNVTAANGVLGYTATGLPPGLTFNNATGIISGIPSLAGNFLVSLTSSNHAGTGGSVVNIAVLNTESSVVQEIWTNVPGIAVSNIPVNAPANITNVIGTLEGTTDYGDNYGERIRGYFTAPSTGNYYFWIAGSDSAQFWLSNDGDPVNKVLRCSVSPVPYSNPPPQNGTAPHQWNIQTNQQSGWLSLVGGQQYYLEVLHKAGVGTSDNWSVAWLQDPTGTNNVPTGVVPGYVLSRFYPPLPVNVPGSLYTANMLAEAGVTSDGVGSATLRVSADGSQAVLNFTFTNLVGTPTGLAINSDPYLTSPEELIFDISAARPQLDGSYIWVLSGTGPLSIADIQEIIAEGKSSMEVQSTVYPNGEISGHFTLAQGSHTFTAPPPPPAWTDDSANSNAAVRFLAQATFGASPSDIASVQSNGYAVWLSTQFSLPVTHALPNVLANPYSDPTDLYQSSGWFNTWWKNSVTAPDQLRQRVAFALSEILVVSENGILQNHADGLSSYYDVLADNAFGNFHTLLKSVTLHPAMGLYLGMLGNNAGSIITGIHADENYAREIQQLFSIGLNREWPDGTLILNSQGNLVPTYNQNVIMGFASVFTGWSYYQTNQTNGRLPTGFGPAANYTNPMVLVPTHHELETKLLLDNVMLPAASGAAANSGLTNFDYYCSQDLEQAINVIFNNQNVGPYICRQLIQRLVTSNPSRDYVYRVVQVFNDDGTGVRGNLQAVVQAILLDYEARSPDLISQPGFGKQREPLERVTQLARAFPAPVPISGTYSQTTNQTITVVTSTPHLLGSGDTVLLTFTDTSGNPAPAKQNYGVTVVNTNTFTITASQLITGTYGQTNGVITVNIGGNAVNSNAPVFLQFVTGGAVSGVYTNTGIIDTSHFTVSTTDTNTLSGSCILPKVTAGGYTQTTTNIVISTTGAHGLQVGDSVYIVFRSGTATNGSYPVAAVTDPTHFTVTTTVSKNQNQNVLTVYPLVAPPLNRSGIVNMQYETWTMNYTDTSTPSLSQSPLRSPTVFNYFYPGYEFPGTLASAGLTTPEFQLTTDSGAAGQMNFIEGGLLNNTGNTNGFSSFFNGNGSIVINLRPWMTPAYTSNLGIPNLVDSMSSLLNAGQLSPNARSSIINFVASTNFAYTTPTYTQMRDRVRAVVHLIVSSPDYMIQK